MVKQCNFCHEELTSPKECSACCKAWYCNANCQKDDWISHIFDCNPRRPITTADHLALAVHKNLLPEDHQTCDDYGFTIAFTAVNRSKLLGLYIGLMDPNRLGVKPKTLHNWRVSGSLIQGIHNAYSKLPENNRGGYYPWFLQNQHVLGGPSEIPDTDRLDAHVNEAFRRAWSFIGGSPSLSVDEIKAEIQKMPENRQNCQQLYLLLLSRWHPSPELPLWLSFGFCACTSEEEEMELGAMYQMLIRKCSFDEFCNAFESSSLAQLFSSKGIQMDKPLVKDVMQGVPTWNKSVWDLKQFISQQALNNPPLFPSVAVDYGFINCKNDSDTSDLRTLYKTVFAHPGADPLKLHEACIAGTLVAYIGALVKLKEKQRFTRLLKNPYPLPDV